MRFFLRLSLYSFLAVFIFFIWGPLHSPAFAQSKSVLQRQAVNIEKDLSGMQGRLVKMADSMQDNERELEGLDNQISAMEKEQTSLLSLLQTDRGALADLTLALARLRRLPPEALLAKPDAPLKTAQSAMLLQSILPSLYEKAESLKINLAKNQSLAQSLTIKRESIMLVRVQIEKDHNVLSTLARKREALYRSTQKNLAFHENRTRRIAAQAKDLKDLVKNLNKERKKQHIAALARNAVAKPALPTAKNKLQRRLPKAGKARLPISGAIKTQFHEPDHFGAPSRGLDIVGRGGALVVAPMGGIIRFSGPFKNYGKMVIIEHKDGYHSLIAGLERLDAVVGQSVLSGEPLGLLHYAPDEEKPVLYYELRYNGKAVNPARKFPSLS